MRTTVNRELSEETSEQLKKGKIPRSREKAYQRLLDRIEKEILTHDVIVNNPFTRWFKAQFGLAPDKWRTRQRELAQRLDVTGTFGHRPTPRRSMRMR